MKRQRRFAGDIEAHLSEIYGVSVGRDTISRVTAAVLGDAKDWQARPLESLYPIVFLDAMGDQDPRSERGSKALGLPRDRGQHLSLIHI